MMAVKAGFTAIMGCKYDLYCDLILCDQSD